MFSVSVGPLTWRESDHSAVGRGPLPSPHHPERAVPEALQQLQLRLSDQAGERGSRLAAGWTRQGRRPRGEGLRGVRVETLHWEDLQAHQHKGIH